MQVHTASDGEVDEVARWRRGQLADAGFSAGLAAEIAGDPHFDLHALIELVERGCPPVLAARILAPLDGEGTALRLSMPIPLRSWTLSCRSPFCLSTSSHRSG